MLTSPNLIDLYFVFVFLYSSLVLIKSCSIQSVQFCAIPLHVTYYPPIMQLPPPIVFSVFLEYLLENWDKASGCLERNLVKETIRAFSITNEELATQGKTSMEGYQKSVDSCKVGKLVFFIILDFRHLVSANGITVCRLSWISTSF